MTARAWAEVVAVWSRAGIDRFYGEEVTIGQHMLQTAALAAAEGAAAALVVAGLLHDVGHLTGDAVPADDRDRDHAVVGHRLLAALLPPTVTEPIRLHVAAKRYLVATDRGYADRLSPTSVHTLALQGGPMTPEEVEAFDAEPHHEAAVRVRRWDDRAKVAGLAVPPLHAYRTFIEHLPPC